jgi:hypothetical protein
MTTPLPMELVEKIMELSYHSTHADQWRRITVQRQWCGSLECLCGRVEVCVDGDVKSEHYDEHWDWEGADVITGERWAPKSSSDVESE